MKKGISKRKKSSNLERRRETNEWSDRWADMEVPSESFHRSSWDSRTCYPRRAFNQGLTDAIMWEERVGRANVMSGGFPTPPGGILQPYAAHGSYVPYTYLHPLPHTSSLCAHGSYLTTITHWRTVPSWVFLGYRNLDIMSWNGVNVMKWNERKGNEWWTSGWREGKNVTST